MFNRYPEKEEEKKRGDSSLSLSIYLFVGSAFVDVFLGNLGE